MRSRILASLALALGSAAIAVAQTPTAAPPPQQEPQRPPTFRTEANFVRVDVYPTQGGNPVLDLRAEDFEVLEDGKPQTIQTFERVVVRPAGPQAQRSEPNSIGESQQLAANPRNRVFVLFLDTTHVSVEGGWKVREPLVRLIDRVLGPDDLVGVMTPTMSAADVVLARKTDVLADGLRERWPWGQRFTLQRDETERRYEDCYPTLSQERAMGQSVSAVAREMKDRKRERATLEALNELVLYLRDLREERKAILTVSEGWVLYRPNESLTMLRTDAMTGRTEPIPGPDPINVGPDGRITTKNRNNSSGASKSDCDADRLRLSMIDDDQYFRDIIGEANRGNASFYTIDPRGLPVFDSPIGPEPPLDIITDSRVLRTRLDSLRTLADATDGMAVLNNNDIDAGLKRMSADLSSYYLLGYYSNNAKLDGRFHRIKVRVKRPGVDVRARNGYRAPTEAEVARAKIAAAPPVPEGRAALTSAMSGLARIRPDLRFTLNAVPIAAADSRAVSTVWVVGELRPVPAGDPWNSGGNADIEVKAGAASTTARVTLGPGERTFAIPVRLTAPAEGGSLEVRARLSGTDPAADPLTDNLKVDMAQGMTQPLLFRRGPGTGNRMLPAAVFQFSRTDRARLEFAVGAAAKPGAGRLLDRGGQPLAIPVTVGERSDAQTGQHWITADVTLAALAAGDYGIELAMTTPAGEQRVVTAIRVAK